METITTKQKKVHNIIELQMKFNPIKYRKERKAELMKKSKSELAEIILGSQTPQY
jgi:hypothetical protein